MIQTIILFIAVFLVVWSIASIIVECINTITHATITPYNTSKEVLFIAIGLTYIIWYCN